MDQQGQPWGAAGDCSGNCKRSHREKCSALGNARGIAVGIRVEIALGIAVGISEKCTGSCKVNCNGHPSGNWTGKCTGNCIGNHTKSCKENRNGNSSGSCPLAAGEPIKSVSMALSLSLLREGGSKWLIAAPLAPRWWNWRAAGTTTSPLCCQGRQGNAVALASTKEALWAGTLQMLVGCPVARPPWGGGGPLCMGAGSSPQNHVHGQPCVPGPTSATAWSSA